MSATDLTDRVAAKSNRGGMGAHAAVALQHSRRLLADRPRELGRARESVLALAQRVA